MKKNQYKCKTAVCPFYKKEDKQVIYCEGVTANSSVHLAFGIAEECKEYKQTRCRGNYKQCYLYRMLEAMNDE